MSSSVKILTVLLISLALFMHEVENKSIFGIGMRIIGDQLLLKDVLQSRPTGIAESPTIGFTYAIPQPITYIEIMSEENILAEVDFSYQHELVNGTIAAINANETISTLQTLEVLITIFGFNDTMLNVSPSYILNRDQHFEGILEPQLNDGEYIDENDDEQHNVDEEEFLNLTSDYFDSLDDDVDVDDNNTDNETDHGNTDDTDDMATDSEHTDKIIEVGRRQKGDYLIYDTYQTSAQATAQDTNHSVVFYYIDSNYITYVQFVVFDHKVDKSTSDYKPPTAEYSHYSPSSLKAIITDHKTTSLFAQMFLYGYQPNDLPVAYQPFLGNSQRGNLRSSTDSPMSPMQRLKMLMNNQQQGGATSQTDNNTDDDDDANDTETAESTEQRTIGANAVVCVDNSQPQANNGASSMSAKYVNLSITTLLGAATCRTLYTAVVSLLFYAARCHF